MKHRVTRAGLIAGRRYKKYQTVNVLGLSPDTVAMLERQGYLRRMSDAEVDAARERDKRLRRTRKLANERAAAQSRELAESLHRERLERLERAERERQKKLARDREAQRRWNDYVKRMRERPTPAR